MRSQRLLWGVYAACAGVVLLTLVWVSVMVVRLEGAERGARAEAQHQEVLRLALWRMDSWVMTRLVQESARPYFEYQSFYPQARAYTRLLYQIESGDILTPSPLLTFRSEYIRLHFQMSPQGELTSPQAPVGDMRRLADSEFLDAATIDSNLATLHHLDKVLRRDMVASCLAANEAEEIKLAVIDLIRSRAEGGGVEELDEAASLQFADRPMAAQKALTEQEFSKRKGSYRENVAAAAEPQQMVLDADTGDQQAVTIGTLTPIWIDDIPGRADHELVFMRSVIVDNAEYFQGFLCDWPALKRTLLSEVQDLVADAVLTPAIELAPNERERGSTLATVPVTLSVGQLAVASAPLFTPVRVTIGMAWLAVLLGMIAVAATLRQSIAFGEKRSRFATAVTHELRTPLTTFRMYTEMLADGMIQDEQQRQTYLTTLKDESGRLASLVENVLSYARLEEGRRVGKQGDIFVGELIARVKPLLERRVTDAGMTLECETALPLETVVHTDAESYNQIVFNLIDNACKYASEAKDRSIQLRIAQESGRLCTTVCDHGSGITADQARMIFEPFERGSFGASDKPGIGLGLALARRLARDLGGDLVCKPGHEGGACFELVLPIETGR